MTSFLFVSPISATRGMGEVSSRVGSVQLFSKLKPKEHFRVFRRWLVDLAKIFGLFFHLYPFLFTGESRREKVGRRKVD